MENGNISNQSKENYHVKINDRLNKLAILFLISAGIIGFFIRFYYFPTNIPFTHDALDYFAYSLFIFQNGHLPIDWPIANNGWPVLVSIFYSVNSDGNFMDYTHIQRILSLSISTMTIVPMYFLAKRFFNNLFSILAATLFIFHPLIINNSLLGITEPLFLFLSILAIFLFLSKQKYNIFISFALIATVAIIRYEGLLLFIPFSIIFFIRFKIKKKSILQYFIVTLIFLSIVIPVAYLRIDTTGEDGFVSHYGAGIMYVSDDLVQGTEDDEKWIIKGENNIPVFLENGFLGLGKNFGLLLIPYFLFLVPISFITILKKYNFQKNNYKISTIILISIVMLLPALYAYGRNIQDPRFIFIILPALCLLAIPILQIVKEKFNHDRLFLVCFFILILLCSFFIMEIQKNNYQHEREIYEIIKIAASKANGINFLQPESRYFKSAEFEIIWPNIPKTDQSNPNHISRDIKRIFADNYDTLEDFMLAAKKNGITHMMVDEKENRVDFLKSIYKNEDEFPFLEKIYDSHENNFRYHVKIYFIDFNQYDNFKN